MITVVKEFTFDAAHWLPGHPGLCANLHGHSYVLRIGVHGVIKDDTGMVIDFSDLKEAINDELEGLDHTCLNDFICRGFPNEMPTAENIVMWMAHRLTRQWERYQIAGGIVFIRLYETPTSYAEWRA